MQLGMIGLGKMGLNMTKRLLQDGHAVVAYDRDTSNVAEAEAAGASGASSQADLVRQLDAPRVAWVMVPAGGLPAACLFSGDSMP